MGELRVSAKSSEGEVEGGSFGVGEGVLAEEKIGESAWIGETGVSWNGIFAVELVS